MLFNQSNTSSRIRTYGTCNVRDQDFTSRGLHHLIQGKSRAGFMVINVAVNSPDCLFLLKNEEAIEIADVAGMPDLIGPHAMGKNIIGYCSVRIGDQSNFPAQRSTVTVPV